MSLRSWMNLCCMSGSIHFNEWVGLLSAIEIAMGQSQIPIPLDATCMTTYPVLFPKFPFGVFV